MSALHAAVFHEGLFSLFLQLPSEFRCAPETHLSLVHIKNLTLSSNQTEYCSESVGFSLLS